MFALQLVMYILHSKRNLSYSIFKKNEQQEIPSLNLYIIVGISELKIQNNVV